MALTAKQRLFVAEYLVDKNATRAAKAAGYSEKTAYSVGQRLLKNVEIQKTFQEQLEAQEKRTLLTADYVLSRLKEVADRCMQGEPVLDKEGNPTGEWRFDSSGANRSLELLGKHLKLFTDKVEATGANGGPLTFRWGGEDNESGD